MNGISELKHQSILMIWWSKCVLPLCPPPFSWYTQGGMTKASLGKTSKGAKQQVLMLFCSHIAVDDKANSDVLSLDAAIIASVSQILSTGSLCKIAANCLPPL